MSSTFLTDLGLLYCTAVWGSTFFIVKDVIHSVHPITLVAYRFLLSALILLPWFFKARNRTKLLKEGAVLSIMLVVLYVSQTMGLQRTTASNSGFITGLFILFVPIFLLIFFKKSPTFIQWTAVIVALTGLWILTGGVQNFNSGDAMTLLAAITYATHLLATDRYVKETANTTLLAFHQFWMTGIICLFWAVGSGASLQVANTRAWWIIIFLTIVPTLSGFFVQLAAQKRTSPVKVALIFSLEPIFAAIFSWTLGGETFKPSSAWGGGLIVGAMVMSELSKFPLRRAAKKEVLPI